MKNLNCRLFANKKSLGNDKVWYVYKKGKVVSRQPIFIVNLKSNTMKNTLQRYSLNALFPNK